MQMVFIFSLILMLILTSLFIYFLFSFKEASYEQRAFALGFKMREEDREYFSKMKKEISKKMFRI